jgi:carbonic anhydrase
VEYAIRVLNVADVIICGHSDCGAMKGILSLDELESLPIVKVWLENAGATSRGLLNSCKDVAELPFDERLQLLAELNVIAQVQNLNSHPAVYEGVRRGTIRVHGWMYEIGTGAIRRLDAEKGIFVPLLPEEQFVAEAVELEERKIA